MYTDDNVKPMIKRKKHKRKNYNRQEMPFFYKVEIPELEKQRNWSPQMAGSPAKPSRAKFTSSKALHTQNTPALCVYLTLKRTHMHRLNVSKKPLLKRKGIQKLQR